MEKEKTEDKRSLHAAEYRKLYKTARWTKGRAWFLRQNPLCVFCGEEGIATPATILDHIKPHKGDEKLFYDQTNWQGLCKPHHDSFKQMLEKNAWRKEIDPVTGWPIED